MVITDQDRMHILTIIIHIKVPLIQTVMDIIDHIITQLRITQVTGIRHLILTGIIDT